jgi:hypothetical protein
MAHAAQMVKVSVGTDVLDKQRIGHSMRSRVPASPLDSEIELAVPLMRAGSPQPAPVRIVLVYLRPESRDGLLVEFQGRHY